ncbi:hypothetical protein PDE01_47870 [Paracoccus denitrificans]|nr:hypothetical protein PDE01_47870 [Paracoccus denitrificans]
MAVVIAGIIAVAADHDVRIGDLLVEGDAPERAFEIIVHVTLSEWILSCPLAQAETARGPAGLAPMPRHPARGVIQIIRRAAFIAFSSSGMGLDDGSEDGGQAAGTVAIIPRPVRSCPILQPLADP